MTRTNIELELTILYQQFVAFATFVSFAVQGPVDVRDVPVAETQGKRVQKFTFKGLK